MRLSFLPLLAPTRLGYLRFITFHDSFTRIASDAHRALAAVRDACLAGDDVIGDNGAADGFTEIDLRFVLPEFTTADQNRAALDLERGSTFFLVVPLNESAIAKADGAFAGNFGDLIARTPESAIHEPHTAGICRGNPNHGRVRAVEGNELTVRDEEGHGCRVFHDQ